MAHNLQRQFGGSFSGHVQGRGEMYFRQGNVTLDDYDADTVLATVGSGLSEHETGLYFKNGVLYGACDCESFLVHVAPCTHLWATLVAAQEERLLQRSLFYGRFKAVMPWDFEDLGVPLLNGGTVPASSQAPPWRRQLMEMQDWVRTRTAQTAKPWPERRELMFSIPESSQAYPAPVMELITRERRKDGSGFNKNKYIKLRWADVSNLPAEDQEILATLRGGDTAQYGYSYINDHTEVHTSYRLTEWLAPQLIERLARAGRLVSRPTHSLDALHPLTWDEGEPWRLALRMEQRGEYWNIAGHLTRPGATLALDQIRLLFTCGLIFTASTVGRTDPSIPWEWLAGLRKHGEIAAHEGERDDLLAAVYEGTAAPPIDMPDEVRIEEVQAPPVPALRIRGDKSEYRATHPLRVDLSFHYDGAVLKHADSRRGLFDKTSRKLIRRDHDFESRARARLNELATACTQAPDDPHWHISEKALPALVTHLAPEGWHVEFDGKSFRAPGEGSLSITSGIDWFDLEGAVDYGGAVAHLPALLQALENNNGIVALDDGSYGLIPEKWLERLRTIAGIGEVTGSGVRFNRTQTGLLDALLAAQPEISFDEGFAQARQQLQRFQGIAPADQPESFTGQLREYQREGLGWMRFLDEFAFGGCLADDMGVGKTVQVLALLEARRTAQDRKAPFLVVVPRSLVFNWKEESTRFAPGLRVLEHTGTSRSTKQFAENDLVLTTYGTLRRDITKLKDIEFDYVILDEAQAIKNAATDTAKAVRLLNGRRRLAMSGTPVENHLGELWSLFEFLNPGMLGGARVLRGAGSELRNPGPETRTLLAHALRPYILRRTKAQVAKELPPKTEQTVFCELDKQQRRLYDEMREYYRASLLQRVDDQGLAKSKMHVLEALLRLRQAACHPGLLDPKRTGDSSAKLDALLGHLESVLEEGHKALVFSQFTKLLGIVKGHLDKSNITYEYLDGKTKDRQACVERFQKDEKCRLFLVSLKAGGLGLNLTAAEYVFLLDPWWNPAVESQAIDRAHRIGQNNQVFAYRLIAKDTVEEKVLELQKTKRDLADAIISADNSLIRSLQREDLELLLS